MEQAGTCFPFLSSSFSFSPPFPPFSFLPPQQHSSSFSVLSSLVILLFLLVVFIIIIIIIIYSPSVTMLLLQALLVEMSESHSNSQLITRIEKLEGNLHSLLTDFTSKVLFSFFFYYPYFDFAAGAPPPPPPPPLGWSFT